MTFLNMQLYPLRHVDEDLLGFFFFLQHKKKIDLANEEEWNSSKDKYTNIKC